MTSVVVLNKGRIFDDVFEIDASGSVRKVPKGAAIETADEEFLTALQIHPTWC